MTAPFINRLEEAIKNPMEDGKTCIVNIDDVKYILQQYEDCLKSLGEIKKIYELIGSSINTRRE